MLRGTGQKLGAAWDLTCPAVLRDLGWGPGGSTGSTYRLTAGSLPNVTRVQHPVCWFALLLPQCSQLAEALMPVAVEWLRASATPAEMCSAAGVCGTALLQDAVWDKVGCGVGQGGMRGRGTW